MFGIVAWDAGHVLAFGLRGNVYESTDGGDSWSRLDTGTEVALMGGTALPGGGAVLVGNEGIVGISLFMGGGSTPSRAHRWCRWPSGWRGATDTARWRSAPRQGCSPRSPVFPPW
jgi:hypothetical protein